MNVIAFETLKAGLKIVRFGYFDPSDTPGYQIMYALPNFEAGIRISHEGNPISMEDVANLHPELTKYVEQIVTIAANISINIVKLD